MKKSRYYPFERNRYFYGKLLTVRDFESEQQYFNDKRRMLNRLLYGSGVITGLQVIAVDDKSVSVEMGAAIDALGREIIVPSPVTLKLSMVDGFTNNEYAKNVYLCIAYDEKGKEPVHSVANASVRTDEVNEYNRLLESYRLFVREQAPDPSSIGYAGLLEETNVLYQDKQVRIVQTGPKYVNPGQVFEVSLRIEKTLQTAKISFNCEMLLQQVEPEKGNKTVISFVEPKDAQETEYEIKYLLRAGAKPNVKGSITVKTETAVLRIGDKQVNVNSDAVQSMQIIEESTKEKLLQDYFNRTLEQSLESSSEPYIYLAQISLLQMGSTYIIEKVHPVPFGEYIYNTSLLHKLGKLDQTLVTAASTNSSPSPEELLKANSKKTEELSYLKKAINKEVSAASAEMVRLKQSSSEVTTGIVEISLTSPIKTGSFFGRAGKSYFSTEVEHGFGVGSAYIITGIEDNVADSISDMLNSSDKVYYGESDVFNESEFETSLPNIKIGTLVYQKKGTFRIGIKLHQPAKVSKVKVRWWAFKQPPKLGQIAGQASGQNQGQVQGETKEKEAMDDYQAEAAAGKQEG